MIIITLINKNNNDELKMEFIFNSVKALFDITNNNVKIKVHIYRCSINKNDGPGTK